MKVIIDIPEDTYNHLRNGGSIGASLMIENAIKNGTPLTPDMLADLLMEERIRGELKQNITYSRDIVDNVECNLIVEIVDRRPCYCGAELREVWRESEDKKWLIKRNLTK